MITQIQQHWLEEDGVLAIEWALILTLLTIGIVGGVSAGRDAIIDELADTAEVMLAVDQSYHIGFPLQKFAHDIINSSASDSDFTDALLYSDCSRPGLPDDFNAPPLPAEIIGQLPIDDFDS
jgi:Flp pilus assembly pilin Flp